ncbi:Prefoldin subunit 6 [Sorochytrium milnesiophthora]
MSLQALEAKLEADVNAFNTLQKEYSKLVSSRQKLDSQLKENEIVNQEFALLDDDAAVYKLIGPVLVKQEQAEAKTNVKKRLEFIRAEIERVEKLLKEHNAKMDKKKDELMKLQTEFQQKRAAAAGPTATAATAAGASSTVSA